MNHKVTRQQEMRAEYSKKVNASNLGGLLREIRQHSGITQEELAEKVGATKYYISRVESGKTDIRVSSLVRLGDGLGAVIIIRTNPL